MAKNLKTIKFGENGETYYVNEYPVKVSGELTEAASEIDFGTFADGLTEVNIATRGISGTDGSYCFITINGVKSGFVSQFHIYTMSCTIQMKKIGTVWFVFPVSNGYGNDMALKINSLLEGVDTITSISLQSYSGTDFPAGMKYALEGR